MAKPNPIISAITDQTAVAADIVPIVPNDTADLDTHARAITCQGAPGDVVLIALNGAQRTVPIGLYQRLDVYTSRVLATGTTATGLFALI